MCDIALSSRAYFLFHFSLSRRSGRAPGSIQVQAPVYSHQWIPNAGSAQLVLVGSGAGGKLMLFDVRKSHKPLAVAREPDVKSIGSISVFSTKDSAGGTMVALSGTGFALWNLEPGMVVLYSLEVEEVGSGCACLKVTANHHQTFPYTTDVHSLYTDHTFRRMARLGEDMIAEAGFNVTASFLPDSPVCVIADGTGCLSFVDLERMAEQ